MVIHNVSILLSNSLGKHHPFNTNTEGTKRGIRRIERSVRWQKIKFVKLWSWLACIFRKNKMKKNPFAKNEPLSAECSDDSIQILRKLSWIVTLTIQAHFRRIYMESSEHDVAYISQIFINDLIFSRWTFFVLFFLDMPTNPIISHIYFLWRHHFSSLLGGHAIWVKNTNFIGTKY